MRPDSGLEPSCGMRLPAVHNVQCESDDTVIAISVHVDPLYRRGGGNLDVGKHDHLRL